MHRFGVICVVLSLYFVKTGHGPKFAGLCLGLCGVMLAGFLVETGFLGGSGGRCPLIVPADHSVFSG